jgi:hypothetical protein
MNGREVADDSGGEEELDDVLGDNAQDAREWFRQQVRTRGLRVAFQALVSVCEDPRAPAPAKATAGTALLRAGGAFAKAEEEGLDEKPLDRMTDSEMERALRRVQAKRKRLSRASRTRDDDEAGGVFD